MNLLLAEGNGKKNTRKIGWNHNDYRTHSRRRNEPQLLGTTLKWDSSAFKRCDKHAA